MTISRAKIGEVMQKSRERGKSDQISTVMCPDLI